jgi:RND family efflux transporter MFP subunit
MKRLKWIAILLVAAAAVVFILLRNKDRNEARIAQKIDVVPTVTVVAARRGQISETLALVGTVAADHDVMVVAETMGRVTAVHVDVGDRVQAGTTLVQVDDELKLAAFKTAEVNFEKAKKDLLRYEALYKTSTVTDSEIESARLACKAAEAQYIAGRRQFRDTRITTPISGVVTSRLVEQGTMVQPGMPIANVVDISHLKVNLQVAESDVFKLEPGQAVTVGTDIYPGASFHGQIRTISDKAGDSHTYRVEVAMANSPTRPLKAGMFVRVVFPLQSRRDALIIPRACLIGSRRTPQVFVVEAGIARRRDITMGAEVGLEIEVSDGLRPGEMVVSDGQNNLDDNSAVTLAAGGR